MKTIYINGTVYTGELPFCQAFAVEGGVFVFTGTREEALQLAGPGDRVVDLQGRFVCPGFNDSHMHLLYYGYVLGQADLASHTGSLKEVKETVGEFIRKREIPAGKWVRGWGWNQDYFTDEKRFPNRHDLDEISTEHPICLTRTCGHASVVNSKALELMGVTKDTPQPEGGCFETDEDGRPNGIFRETAMDLIFSCVPEPAKEEIQEMILEASRELNRYGITSAQTDDLAVFQNLPYERVLEAYRELADAGKMTVRVYEQARLGEFSLLQEFVEKGYGTGQGDAWFRIGPLKLLGDGSLGARTAYLSQPYTDDPATRGIAIYTKEQFQEMISYANAHQMQVAVHAIGDGILDDILEAFRQALQECPREDHRHGVVHCQITRPEQLEAFGRWKLHAYIQSIFLDYDIHIVEDRVGKERAATSYQFRTLYDQTTVSNGSDCPVELPDVMKGIQCAVTRCSADGATAPYLPDQALRVQQALDSFTKQGAFASFEEKLKGQIRPGMLADFVVLEENPFEADPARLKDIAVCATFTDGRCRYALDERWEM